MIVTCPGCSSKYRVRNEAVPPDGARMRCPKCETLFLAKLPAGADAGGGADDPSAQYQQLSPTPATGPQARPAPPMSAVSPTSQAASSPQAAAPAAAPAHGPITALFQAFDAAALPVEAQRPPQPAPAPLPPPAAPSGLELGDNTPLIRIPNPAPPTPAARPPEAAPHQARMPRGSERGPTIGSWAALGAGVLGSLFGLVFFLWGTETANLDGALMPAFEKTFGVEPPRSSVGRGDVSADQLRQAAAEATARGDLPAAVVLWQRVKARVPADPRAAAAIAKLRTDLGDLEGTP